MILGLNCYYYYHWNCYSWKRKKTTAKNESSAEQASKSSDSEGKEKVFNRDQTVQYDGMNLKDEDIKYLSAKYEN